MNYNWLYTNEAVVDMTGQTRTASVGRCLLRMTPQDLEYSFWNSDQCVRTYTRCDLLAVSYSIVVNMMLLRTFRAHMFSSIMWHSMVGFVLYPASSCLQLAIMVKQGQLYRRYRLHITAANRLGRLLMVVLSAALSNAQNMAVITGTVTSNAGAYILPQSNMLKLCRILVAHPLVYLAAANFVLPFRFVLPCQVITFVLAMSMARHQACWFAESPGMQHLIMHICKAMGQAMYSSTVIFGRSCVAGGKGSPAEQLCSSGLTASLVLILFLHTVLLILVPCYLVYHVERSLKSTFVKAQSGRSMQIEWPDSDERVRTGCPLLVHLLIITTGCMSAWFVCIAFVSQLGQLECDGPRGLVVVSSGR